MEVHRKDGDIENRPVSKGGKLFDVITYVGIAGVGTFFATIPTAKSFMSGRMKGVSEALHHGFTRLGASESFASEATKVTNYMWGGNLMLVAVGVMEYFRTPLVKAFNRLFNDPTDPRSVEDAPPQTLGSIVKGRAVAWLTVFTGFKGTKSLVGAERYEKALDYAGETWAKIRRNPGAFETGRIGAEDVLATASSATLLYIGSHFFAKRAYEKKAEKNYVAQKEQRGAEPLSPSPTDGPLIVPESPARPGTSIRAVQREARPLAAPAAEPPPLASL